MTTETGYVYTLTDPRTEQVRYVGATKYPAERLRQHLKQPTNEDMAEWIGSLKSAGLTPDMHLIDVASVDELSRRERAALDRLSARFELFNKKSGGYNQPGSQSANMGRTTVSLDDETADVLHTMKERGDSYDDVVRRLIEDCTDKEVENDE